VPRSRNCFRRWRRAEQPLCELTTLKKQLTTRHCELTTPKKQLTTRHCELTTPKKQLTTRRCELTKPKKQLTTRHCELTKPKKQLTTRRCELTKPLCQLVMRPSAGASIRKSECCPHSPTGASRCQLMRTAAASTPAPGDLARLIALKPAVCCSLDSSGHHPRAGSTTSNIREALGLERLQSSAASRPRMPGSRSRLHCGHRLARPAPRRATGVRGTADVAGVGLGPQRRDIANDRCKLRRTFAPDRLHTLANLGNSQGRPWLPEITDVEARAAAQFMETIAEWMLHGHEHRRSPCSPIAMPLS
jgi:hypothetical protein